jgi:pimeloyl-ACP methyl ester carboxylesterase
MKRLLVLLIGGLAAGAVLLARRVAIGEDLDWTDVPRPGRVVDIDGYGVHYVEQGAGPAIVLIHGFGGHTCHFRKIMPLLARGHRVVALDLKGYGYSQRDARAGLSFTDQSLMVRKLMRHLGIDRAVIVGHSMGGAVARRFAAAYPEATEALVLVASVTGEEHMHRRMPPAPLVKWLMPVGAGLVAGRILKASYYDPSVLTPEAREEYLRPIRLKGSLDGLLQSVRDGAGDLPIDDARIAMPVLLLYGADDRVVPLSAAQRIRECLPHARLAIVERAGHLLYDERPDECARFIEDFLATSTSDSGATFATPA